MKIISKYKDYYDYLQGIFGIDNYKIYKRDKIFKEHEFDLKFEDFKDRYLVPHFFYSFAINNTIYVMVKTKKGIFPLSKKLLKSLKYDKYEIRNILNLDKRKTDINKEHRKPIIIGNESRTYYRYSSLININWKTENDPYLKSFSFHKVLSAQEIYIEIDSFLGWMKDNPEIPNKQTNAEKLLAKGFDKKISFRHRK
ncbi:MAG: hypothetical protein ACPG4Y_09130 [Chitinophagales bacterium]